MGDFRDPKTLLSTTVGHGMTGGTFAVIMYWLLFPIQRFRFPRFSLRKLTILVTLTCVALAIVAMQVSRVRKQNKVVDTVRKLGGQVTFFHDARAHELANGNPQSLWHYWILNIRRHEYFRQAISIGIRSPATVPDELQVTNEHLATFAGTPSVERLVIENQEQVTDRGLLHIAKLKQLQSIVLRGTGIEGHGLRHLTSLRELKGLNLAKLPLSDEDILPLKSLENLEYLNLGHTQISDKSLSTIASLDSLSKLYLNNTEISDGGLERLYGLTHLKILVLYQTNVTEKGCKKIKRALPSCDVYDDYDHLQLQCEK